MTNDEEIWANNLNHAQQRQVCRPQMAGYEPALTTIKSGATVSSCNLIFVRHFQVNSYPATGWTANGQLATE